jgi:hypothetical protein
VIADLFSEVPNGFSGGNIIDQNVNVNVNINVKSERQFRVSKGAGLKSLRIG